MRAGGPMLVMPFAHDQHGNAERVRRLGIARILSRRRYGARRTAGVLRSLLGNSACLEKAEEVARSLRAKYSTPQKRGRFERRLCPDASLRSVGVPALPPAPGGGRVRLRKAASLARLACGQIRSLKRLPLDFLFCPKISVALWVCWLPRRIQPPFYGAPY